MIDKRRLLRATEPSDLTDRIGKMVQVELSGEEYRILYNIAFDKQLSLADAIRQLIRGHY